MFWKSSHTAVPKAWPDRIIGIVTRFTLLSTTFVIGITYFPYSVAMEYQGKAVSFELAAHTEYPGGRGRLLRFKDGLRVGTRHKSGADTALMLVSGLAGHLHYTSQARFRVQLPQGVSVSAPPPKEVISRTVWRPGMPAEGIVEAVRALAAG